MSADRQTPDVLEHEVAGVEFGNDPHELSDQQISRVLKGALTNHREALAGRAPEHDVDQPVPDTRRGPYLCASEPHHRPRKHGAVRKIEFMRRGVDRIDLYSSHNIEPGLLKP